MPRIIEERWIGIGFDVRTEQAPVVKDGQPLHDAGTGLPKTQEVTVLTLVLPMPDGQRVVHIPFEAAPKAELIQKLTGGIVVPNGVAI